MKNPNPPKPLLLTGIATLLAVLASVILAGFEVATPLQQIVVAGVFLTSFGGLYACAFKKYARSLTPIRVTVKRTARR